MKSLSKLLRNIYLPHVYIHSERPGHYQIYPMKLLSSHLLRNISLSYVYINIEKPDH